MHAVLTHRLLITASLLLFALVFFGPIAALPTAASALSMAPAVPSGERTFAPSAI